MSGATPTMSSIGLASGGTRDISTINNEEKDKLIHSLQQELDELREQVGEFNDLWMSVIKTTGNNGVRKLKDKYLTTTEKINANEIAYLLRENLWTHVKLMPKNGTSGVITVRVFVNALWQLLACQVVLPPKIIGWGLHDHLPTKNCVQFAPTSNKVSSISFKVFTSTQIFLQHLFINIVCIIFHYMGQLIIKKQSQWWCMKMQLPVQVYENGQKQRG
jgi:hypothetical protein